METSELFRPRLLGVYGYFLLGLRARFDHMLAYNEVQYPCRDEKRARSACPTKLGILSDAPKTDRLPRRI